MYSIRSKSRESALAFAESGLCLSNHRSHSWRPSGSYTSHPPRVVCLLRFYEAVDHLLRARRFSSLAKKPAVDSTGERNGLCQCISRGTVGEGLAGTAVEFECDRIEVVLAVL